VISHHGQLLLIAVLSSDKPSTQAGIAQVQAAAGRPQAPSPPPRAAQPAERQHTSHPGGAARPVALTTTQANLRRPRHDA